MTAASRVLENPFLVLGLPPSASRMEIEREAQKLLGMLELGFPAAKTYPTPLGPHERTAELVRAAVATLRDPAKRLAAEIWARSTPLPSASASASASASLEGFPDALVKLGWRAP
jgi:hypothetical protein